MGRKLSNKKNRNPISSRIDKALGLRGAFYITISGIVTEHVINAVWEIIIDKRRENPTQPICLLITTDGGDWNAARNFFSKIESHGMDIITVAVGALRSAGIFLLAAGKKRYAHFSTEFMIHELSLSCDDATEKNVNNALSVIRLSNRVLANILLKITKLTKSQIRSLANGTELHFDAKEAKRIGLIHKIIDVHKRKGRKNAQ